MKWEATTQGCERVNSAGFPYEEISCVYPSSIGWTYFEWEIKADVPLVRDWMAERPWIPLVAVSVYILWITLGPRFLIKERWQNWRNVMAVWNICLSTFSGWGMLRLWPQLLHNAQHYTLRENFCMDPESAYGSGSTGLWVQLFVLSKIPELLDTFFIVIHKKPLIFLHWYHHVSVLVYCWHSYVTKSPTGILFGSMNYAVHCLMYAYYGIMAFGYKPPIRGIYVTMAQISQMIVGVAATVYGWYVVSTTPSDQDCWLSRDNNLAATLMYGSYLALFVQFFVGRYYSKQQQKSTKKE